MTLSAPIELADYDPNWPAKFAAERDLLGEALKPWTNGPIEHVGSTAIPGIRAKPVIDIMVAVSDLPSSRPALPVLETLDYQYWPHRAEVMHWFCKPSDAFRTHHLHLIPIGSPLWCARLAFRDYLRGHQATADEYVALKEDLAARFRHDREAYTDGKQSFVERVVELALTESGAAS